MTNPESSTLFEEDKSQHLTEGLALEAISNSMGQIQELVDNGTFAKPDMFVAVAKVITLENGVKTFEVVGFVELGNLDGWEYRFDEYALVKMAISARTGLDSGVVIDYFPNLLEADEIPAQTVFAGSVTEQNIIVACSSIEDGDKDEIVSRIVLKNCLEQIDKAQGIKEIG